MIEFENLKRFNEPFEAEFQARFEQFIDAGRYVLGQNLRDFERQFAQYVGVSCAVGVGSGLDALTLALKAHDFRQDGEVLVPSNTYVASILAILHAGLTPVLVEPNLATYNVDAEELEKQITPRTVAALVVHLYGKACGMDAILDVAERHGLKIIEDAAQAHGARHRGRSVGSFGVGAFSFYPTKNLGALGDGGAVTSDDGEISKRISMLRDYGRNPKLKYENQLVGFNSRLDDLQAAMLSVKLGHLDEIIAHKRRLAAIYDDRIDPRYIKPVADESHVYHIYNIRHPQRDALAGYLQDHGIGSDIHYPVPPHRQPALQGLFAGDYPIAEEIHRTTLSLPISFFHTPDDAAQVADTVNAFLDSHL